MKYKYLVIVFMIFLSSLANAKDYKDQFATYGVGSESCTAYSYARKQGGLKEDVYRQWLAGYISAFNLIISATNYDIFGSTDFEGMMDWLDDRCAKYPRANMTNVVARFTEVVFPYRIQVKDSQ